MPAGTALSPADPFRDDRTRNAMFPGVLEFEQLMAGAPSGFDSFDLESAYLAVTRMSTSAANRLPLAVLLAIMETEGVKLFAPVNRLAADTGDASKTLVWEALSRNPAFSIPRLRPTTVVPFPADVGPIARGLWLSWPYGLDRFALPPTDADVNARVARIAAAGVYTPAADDDPSGYIRRRVWAGPNLLPLLGAGMGVIQIWKRSRRMHWAALSLMAGFFRQLEVELQTGTGGYAGSVLPSPAWLPAGASPPDLSGRTPTDTQWKDYLTYYALVYMSYNSSPATVLGLVAGATAAHGASPLGMRDFLLFQHNRSHVVLINAVRFMIALDAYLRLDYMQRTAPRDYDKATPQTVLASARTWTT
jgi:hypothetical protein